MAMPLHHAALPCPLLQPCCAQPTTGILVLKQAALAAAPVYEVPATGAKVTLENAQVKRAFCSQMNCNAISIGSATHFNSAAWFVLCCCPHEQGPQLLGVCELYYASQPGCHTHTYPIPTRSQYAAAAAQLCEPPAIRPVHHASPAVPDRWSGASKRRAG